MCLLIGMKNRDIRYFVLSPWSHGGTQFLRDERALGDSSVSQVSRPVGSSQVGSEKTKGLAKGWTRVLVHKAGFIEYLLGESCSVPQSCLTLGNPLDCCTPGCVLLSPGVCSNSCSLSWWCHPTISSSVIPFFSCLQSFPASGSFPVSWLLASGGTSIGASASASVLPRNIQGWFIGAGITNWLVWCPCCPRDSQESSPAP